MGHRRSGTAAGAWVQLDLTGHGAGVGGRQAQGEAAPGGGGYLDGCNPSEVRQRVAKNFAKNSHNLTTGDFSIRRATEGGDLREEALLAELEAMGLSRLMLKIARAIGFDAFLTMWRILDDAPETLSDNGSGIDVRLPKLAAYRRYQRNRFIEALAAMGQSRSEISVSVKRELREKVSDRHILRLMAESRVKP